MIRAALCCVCLLLACPGIVFGQAARFRVCADPENLPFSNQKLEGFENRIADLIAPDVGAKPSYIWWGQRVGFIRNTMNATLDEGRCEIVLGVPRQYDLVRTTTPYYRSTYVFVYPKGKGIAVTSLDDPILKKLKVGVHLLGADYTNPPPVHELSKRGVVENVVGFSTFYSERNPPGAIVDAVASGRVDIAIVWGPAAGYFAKRQKVPLELVPVPSGTGDLPFAFDISMGVKRGQDALHAQLEQILRKRQPEITKILEEYGVPIVGAERQAPAPTRPPSAAPAAAAAVSATYRDVYNGWKWWHVYCYRCHGQDATGSTLAPNIADPARRLAPAAFLRIVRNGIPDSGMAAWDKLLDDAQIRQVHLYVRARADKVLPPGRPDEVGPNGGRWVPPPGWPPR